MKIDFLLSTYQLVYNTTKMEQIQLKKTGPINGTKIAICGNIGVGKTTLCAKLVNYFESTGRNVKFAGENFDECEDLPKFYEKLKTNPGEYNEHFYHVEKFFLKTKHDADIHCTKNIDIEIHDRSIHDIFHIFIRSGYETNMCTNEEFKMLTDAYENYVKVSRYDSFVFLFASPKIVIERIKTRGREMEKNISIDYIAKINEYYEDMLNEIKKNNFVIIIDTNCMDENQVFNEVVKQLSK